jgi:alanine-glyoxylate transaminase/serine-glyoxylate transaminase/serine-pyruvate transaminase
MNQTGYWPYTPNTNLLYALSESLDMLLGKGWNVFARHQRWAAGVRAAVRPGACPSSAPIRSTRPCSPA